jgi:hypothetical protein
VIVPQIEPNRHHRRMMPPGATQGAVHGNLRARRGRLQLLAALTEFLGPYRASARSAGV